MQSVGVKLQLNECSMYVLQQTTAEGMQYVATKLQLKRFGMLLSNNFSGALSSLLKTPAVMMRCSRM